MEELLAINTRLQADKTRAVKERNDLAREIQQVELISNQLENEKSSFVREISRLQLEKLQLESSLENLQSEKHELESHHEDQQQLVTEKQTLDELKKDLEDIKISQEAEPHLLTTSPQSLSEV